MCKRLGAPLLIALAALLSASQYATASGCCGASQLRLLRTADL